MNTLFEVLSSALGDNEELVFPDGSSLRRTYSIDSSNTEHQSVRILDAAGDDLMFADDDGVVGQYGKFKAG
jgi:hypothetical protein